MSPNALPPADRRFYKGKGLDYGEVSMAKAIAAAGGIPFMVYHGPADADAIVNYVDEILERADALVLSGGEDIAPEHYGESVRDEAWRGNKARDALELALYAAAVRRGMPVLGVCRGAQLITVAEGGSLWQDLESMRVDSLVHRSQEAYDALGHALELDADTFLGPLFDGESVWVNSVHHQGMKAEPATLKVLARAPDGLPEAFELRRTDAWVVGVQWHPEWMQERPSQRRLFERFILAARR